MAALPSPDLKHRPEKGSPYCSDPNCKFCNDLRKVQQLVSNGKPVTASGSDKKQTT